MNVLYKITIIMSLTALAFAGECKRDIAIGGAPCTRDFDCGNNFNYGRCRNATCVCNTGYLDADCGYPAKRALDVGLSGLALLAGIPAIPALIAQDLMWGLPQLLMGIPPLIGAIIGSVFLCRGRTTGAVMGVVIGLVVLGFLAYLAGCAWTIADAVMYGTKVGNHACDGNGYPLL